MSDQHECDTWETLHEVRHITRPTDPAYRKGEVGAEHDHPYRVLLCAHGEKRIEPFTPRELEVVDVLDNTRESHASGVARVHAQVAA